MTQLMRLTETVVCPNGSEIRLALPLSTGKYFESVFWVEPIKLLTALVEFPDTNEPSLHLDALTRRPIIADELQIDHLSRLLETSTEFPMAMPRLSIGRRTDDQETYHVYMDAEDIPLFSLLMHIGAKQVPVCVTSHMLENDYRPQRHISQRILNAEHTGKLATDMETAVTPQNAELLQLLAPDLSDGILITELAKAVDWAAFCLLEAKLNYNEALEKIDPTDRRSQEKLQQYENDISNNIGFDLCRDLIDIAVCAGVTGVHTKSYRNGKALFRDLELVANMANEQIHHPTDTPENLANRFVIIIERLFERICDYENDRASMESVNALKEMVVPLGQAIIDNGNASAVIQTIVSKQLAQNELRSMAIPMLDWLRQNPEATALEHMFTEVIPRPRPAYMMASPSAT